MTLALYRNAHLVTPIDPGRPHDRGQGADFDWVVIQNGEASVGRRCRAQDHAAALVVVAVPAQPSQGLDQPPPPDHRRTASRPE
jgi:hypothetical protein